VRRLLSSITENASAEQGDANWLSGKPLPKGVFYCPISLAFQPHIDRIDASNKLKTVFEWDGEKLKSVTPTFDKNEHVTAEKKISLAYDEHARQVAWASDGDEARPAASGRPRRSLQAILGAPAQQSATSIPLAIQQTHRKERRRSAVAGNRFFNPFVWEKVYYFRLTYDDQRASQPRAGTERSQGHAPEHGAGIRMERHAVERHPRLPGEAPRTVRADHAIPGRQAGRGRGSGVRARHPASSTLTREPAGLGGIHQ
jgi:hypothetical protein